MWDLGSRGVLVLISVLSGCVFLYNLWGPFLLLTASLCLVVYACYSLLVNDSLISPHAYLLLEHCNQATHELRRTLYDLLERFYRYARVTWQNSRERLLNVTMDRRRRTSYQLSTDSYAPSARNESRLGLIGHLSPIPRAPYKGLANNATSESKLYHDSDTANTYNHSSFEKHTSTPVYRRKKDDTENGALDTSGRNLQKKTMHLQNHTLTRAENTSYFSSDGSPWGTSISPKMRPKAGGVKTVQTVAGPLLASTRYNIDPKVYNDVTSPGLTTRLTKYATEANTKLTHQSQYCTGQFPKVNLNASPTPLINSKTVKQRMPVTVRVAPPDTTRYSPPSRQSALSKMCHVEHTSPPSVDQVLREISLKRHASRENVATELAKKQRTDGTICEEIESSEEGKQKRSRDESSKSEEDVSPQNKSIRPTKRTKTPSCYDVINSLSSSIHVISGVKRKAMDFSRSGTPDFGKHFKSLESVSNTSAQSSPQMQSVITKQTKDESKEKSAKRPEVVSTPTKSHEPSPVKGILKTSNRTAAVRSENKDVNKDIRVNHANMNNVKASSPGSSATVVEPVNLTDKLFMRAEPQKNEKLRRLVQEQGTIKAKFTSDDVEEIKKEDIVNMRQTSMKARLQSMFDAISGKASRINPDVVIQAEDISATKTPTSSVTCATLNSSTTTTNVNTTPISTSAIAPGFPAAQPESKPVKHVAFNIPSKEPTTVPSVPAVTTVNHTTPSIFATSANTTASRSEVPSVTSTVISTATSTMSTNVSSPSVPSFTFGKPSSGTTVNTPSSGTFTFGIAPTSTNISTPNTVTVPSTASTSNLPTSTATTVTPSSVSSGIFGTKTEGISFGTTKASQPISSTQPTFTFGKTTSVSIAPTTSAQSSSTIAEIKTPSAMTTSLTSTSNTSETSSFKSLANTFKPPVSSTPSSIATTSASSRFSFGSKSNALQTTKSESFVFGGGNSFGSPMSTNVVASTPASTSASANTQSAFSMNVNNTTSAFGSPKTTPAFTFGTPTMSTSSAKPGFSFGATTASSSILTGTTSTTTAAPSTTNNAQLTFGAASTNNNVSQIGTGSAPIFGSTSNTPMFGSNTQPVFGTPSSAGTSNAFGAPKTTCATIFGTNATTTSGTTSVFGNNVSSTTSSSLFSNVNATTNASSTTVTTSVGNFGSNIFGQSKPPAFGTSTGVFGSTNATPSLFGSQPTTASTFGSANVTSNVTAAPTFGATNTMSSTFGSRNAGDSTTKSPPTQTFGSGTSVFGANTTSAPVFGTATGGFNVSGNANVNANASTNAFGSTTSSAFGNTTSSTFGTAGSASTFGDNKPSLFGSQPTGGGSAFGAPNTSTPAFGSSGSTENTSGNVFTFGGNQKQPLQQNTGTFTFGGNAVASNGAVASTSTPFQFGASTSKPASTGFNFSAPSSTPSINFGASGSTPTFNAPTPGMFNIGSGSTAPRSRNGRQRKPR